LPSSHFTKFVILDILFWLFVSLFAGLSVVYNALVLRPLVKRTRKSRYTLDELLHGMTRDNVPQEVDWGPRRGNEAW
jgi:hypothetical protein